MPYITSQVCDRICDTCYDTCDRSMDHPGEHVCTVHAPTSDAVETLESHVWEVKRLEGLTAMYVRRARAAGATWADIGNALAVSRQAAKKRYGDLDATFND